MLSPLLGNNTMVSVYEYVSNVKIDTQELKNTFTINDFLSNNREQISSSNSITKRWVVPIAVTLGVGATVYAVYSVRGR